MALPARKHDEPSLASLIERSAELKRALVGFALSPRFERQMERFVLESGSDEIPHEGEAIDAIDRFALQHTLPNGKTVLDQFLASRPDLTAADREQLHRLFVEQGRAHGLTLKTRQEPAGTAVSVSKSV